MIRRPFFAAAASLAALTLAPQPLAAQGNASETDQAMAMMGAMFPAEPLTAEQEARLPQTRRIIERMIPEGTLGEMMGGVMEKMVGPMMGLTGGPAMNAISQATGLAPGTLDLPPEQAEELAALFDPAYAERHAREMGLMPDLMREMMAAMEPGMRKAMAELYAIHFSQAELDDIETFFQTDSGTAYARKSFTMSSDPRIISATMESLPQVMASFSALETRMKAATAGLPPKRRFAELSAAEKARVARATGYTVAQIEEQAAGGRGD